MEINTYQNIFWQLWMNYLVVFCKQVSSMFYLHIYSFQFAPSIFSYHFDTYPFANKQHAINNSACMLLTKLNRGSCFCWIPDTCSAMWMGWCFSQCAWLSTCCSMYYCSARNSLFVVELINVILHFSILIRFHLPFVGMDLWFVIYGMSDYLLTLHVLGIQN